MYLDIERYIEAQREWSLETFGEGQRTEGICKHIEKELQEIRENPTDVTEWADVVILALDGAWRAGFDPLEIEEALDKKQEKNFARQWPSGLSLVCQRSAGQRGQYGRMPVRAGVAGCPECKGWKVVRKQGCPRCWGEGVRAKEQ